MPFFSGGGGGGGGVTPPVTITGTDPATTPLTVTTAAAQSADAFLVEDALGDWALRVHSNATQLFAGFTGQGGSDFSEVDVGSGVTLRDETGAATFVVDASHGLSVSTATMGFFSAPSVAQPAHPTTLADVIAALVALGLVHA